MGINDLDHKYNEKSPYNASIFKQMTNIANEKTLWG